MKFVKKLLVGITTLAVIITINAYEPIKVNGMTNGDMDSAQEITVGDKIKDTVTDNPEVWYKFTTSKEKEPWYRVECIYKDDSNYGPRMYLYDEEGIELFREDMGDGENNLHDIKLDPNTTYYIYISFSKNTDYTLDVQEIKDDVSDTEDGAKTIISGIKINGTFESVSDTDMYTFIAGSTKTEITASLKYKKRFAYVKVYNEDGTMLLNKKVYDTESETFTVQTEKGEPYTIEYFPSEQSYDNVDFIGSYSLKVKSGSTDIKYLTMDGVYNKETKDIYLFNGKTHLVKGTDYTISVGKVSKGKVKVTVKGKGGYQGNISKVCYVAGN